MKSRDRCRVVIVRLGSLILNETDSLLWYHYKDFFLFIRLLRPLVLCLLKCLINLSCIDLFEEMSCDTYKQANIK